MAGVRSTGGAIELVDHVPTRDADVVAAVRAAGAIPFGKTNVPRWSGDLQTFNEIFGTTNNPWDTTRVPGGSSGGAATSVAMGFTGFELGTDIGGSIRVPAAYCGVAGHKPSFGLVPCGGYLDRVDYGSTEPDINVHGPIARSVDDLELVLDVITGPRPDRRAAVRHQLPASPPRPHRQLPRRGVVRCRRVPVVGPHRSRCREGGRRAGVVGHSRRSSGSPGPRCERGEPARWMADRVGDDAGAARRRGRLLRDACSHRPVFPSRSQTAVGAYVASHRDWLAADVARTRLREAWHRFFGDVDVLVCPVSVSPPFHHTQDGTVADRRVLIDGVPRPYLDLLWWTMLIGMAYLPSTVVPVDVTPEGLPVAVQVVGPYLEDRTPLAVARALRESLGPMRFPEAAITPSS